MIYIHQKKKKKFLYLKQKLPNDQLQVFLLTGFILTL